MSREEKKICIIGAGASGSMCALLLSREYKNITLYDFSEPLRTILPTGGGRCNLSNAVFDPKELAQNYPRGEKFLYSVFSRFGVYDTITLFNELDIKTYTQENGRIFPVSNSSKEVRDKILKRIRHLNFRREKVLKILPTQTEFEIKTENGREKYTHVIVATGGHFGYSMLSNLGINIIDPKPSLVGLKTKEDFKEISGVVLKNIKSKDISVSDDLLFTHFGISGPLTFTLSSIYARRNFPYTLNFELIENDYDLQSILNTNPHKDIKNILSEVLPKNFVKYFLIKSGISPEQKGHEINGKTRDKILNGLQNFKITITGTDRGEETVTAGGVDLKEVEPKTLMSKKYKNLYFCGEVLDIDGFCGGFNLQNAWSTAYIVSRSIIND